MTNEKMDKKSPNVPNLRFPGFEGEWKRYRISEILDFFPTNSLSWEQLEYSNDDNLLNLHYGLIHKGLPIQIDIKVCNLPHIKKESTPKNYTVCKDGDIAFADASEDTNDVGKVVEFLNCAGKKIVCGLHTIHGRDKKKITVPGFKGYAFSSMAFRNQIKRLAQGTKIFSLCTKNFSESYISIPSKAEQAKIANFLLLLDQRISTQNKIIEDLKLLKSTLSKLLLLNESWRLFRIKDIASLGRGRVISSIEINKQQNPKYPVYSSQTSNNGVMGYLDGYNFDGEYVTWTTDGANAGTVFYRNGKFNCTNVCGILKIKSDHNPYFVALCLNLLAKKYVFSNLANPKLMNNIMANIEIYLPDKQEQNRIVKLFVSLANKIECEISILEAFQEKKKYLLREMFI